MKLLVRAADVLLVGVCVTACGASAAGPSPLAANPPVVSKVSPTTGSVGTEVVVTGSQFAATGNHVKFGDGYIKNLASTDGKTLRFTVPDGLDLCAPDATGPCPGAYPPTKPGDYSVAVMNGDGKSNAVTFTVTAR